MKSRSEKAMFDIAIDVVSKNDARRQISTETLRIELHDETFSFKGLN